MKLLRVIIESPYSGDIPRNTLYARRALADSLSRGEAPSASHLLYTQPGVLDDSKPKERLKGMNAGFAWTEVAELVAVYVDYGVSDGMQTGIDKANKLKVPVEYRRIGKNPE
jgi:hypothetical protein